jgi:hypothetical protein
MSHPGALEQIELLAIMIRAMVPVMNDFTVFSSSISADALTNTLIPGSVIRDRGFSELDSASSPNDNDD